MNNIKLPIRIAPSILNANHDDMLNEMLRVSSTSDLIHLDIMDNIFVPNKTFTLEQSKKYIAESPLPIDSHLMVIEPEYWGEQYAKIGSASVTFHLEAATNPLECIDKIHGVGAKVGIAIKPHTSWETVLPYLDLVEMILIMTVEPGFGGQKFMESMMGKVELLRSEIDTKHEGKISIEVDGGISTDTIAVASSAGADTFVAGSAVYKADDPAQIVTQLRGLAQSAKQA